mmetsp:Transcript_2129/g.7713  ORF Transcript_2129/g.7713 Transcript_2129/m.7713 type:complete len:206 (-) Transcript_2129:41-658(-)
MPSPPRDRAGACVAPTGQWLLRGCGAARGRPPSSPAAGFESALAAFGCALASASFATPPPYQVAAPHPRSRTGGSATVASESSGRRSVPQCSTACLRVRLSPPWRLLTPAQSDCSRVAPRQAPTSLPPCCRPLRWAGKQGSSAATGRWRAHPGLLGALVTAGARGSMGWAAAYQAVPFGVQGCPPCLEPLQATKAAPLQVVPSPL